MRFGVLACVLALGLTGCRESYGTQGGDDGGSDDATEDSASGDDGADESNDTTDESTDTTDESTTGVEETLLYSFSANLCNAEIATYETSDDGTPQVLGCSEGDGAGPSGWASFHPSVEVEGETFTSAIQLSSYPMPDAIGQIVYRSVDVSDAVAPKLRTRIACWNLNCFIAWQINIQVAGASGPPLEIREGVELSDDEAEIVEIDLAPYKGDALDIVLSMNNNGMFDAKDAAYFDDPRIVD